MNKSDLAGRIARSCGLSQSQAMSAIGALTEHVTAALRKGDRVALLGFGTFSTTKHKARNGRNPQTGAPIKIAARRVARFKAGGELKKAMKRAT